jgi:predicted ATP-dependent endonuclease of OLD family
MRLNRFRVMRYRNIIDTGWINTTDVTAFVGQNEAGKSNLFDALNCLNPFEPANYNVTEDWPMDDWPNHKDAKGKRVCEAIFRLDGADIAHLFEFAMTKVEVAAAEEGEEVEKAAPLPLPNEVEIICARNYGENSGFGVLKAEELGLDVDKAAEWAKVNVPKFVLIHDYEMTGTQIELDALKGRLDAASNNRNQLSNEDQTILIVLDLAKIDLDEFIKKGASSDGRTVRSFDKRAASSYLTQQFQKLWTQKKVKFDIDIDGPTLNIFAEDEALGFPVRLNRRSTGFRWYVSFAWKFTHASNGAFQNCILLLEEPGIHLHYSGQRDLLGVFEGLSATNTILYTTHLSSMVDQSNPERVRIVESRNNHLAITHGVVSSHGVSGAVIETALGLTPDMSGMLGNRKVLIVEGGTDSLILNKLSGVFKASGKQGLSDQIYMWSSETATKVPMYAAFSIGQRWKAAVLLDTDKEGKIAKGKIDAMGLKELADSEGYDFRVLMLGDAAGIKKTDVGIEDLFPNSFYIDCVNATYGLAIKEEDLPVDGSTLITSRVEVVLKNRTGQGIDKKRVLKEMLNRFDKWAKIDDLDKGTAKAATKLFESINGAFKLE